MPAPPVITPPPHIPDNLEIYVLKTEFDRLSPDSANALYYTMKSTAEEIVNHLELFGQLDKQIGLIITNARYFHHSNTDRIPHYTARVFSGEDYLGGVHLYWPCTGMAPYFLPDHLEAHGTWQGAKYAAVVRRSLVLFLKVTEEEQAELRRRPPPPIA